MTEQTIHKVHPLTVERLQSFSDNIYAFSMTLLITTIHLPDLAPSDVPVGLPLVLIRQWRQFAFYILSFLNIGSYWMLSHFITAYIARLNNALIWLQIFLLLTVTFLPVPTALVAKYGRASLTAMFYGATIGINYLLLCLILYYLHRHRQLVRTDVPKPDLPLVLCKFGLPVLLAVIGMALSFKYPSWSFHFYFCVILVNLVPWQAILKKRH